MFEMTPGGRKRVDRCVHDKTLYKSTLTWPYLTFVGLVFLSFYLQSHCDDEGRWNN